MQALRYVFVLLLTGSAREKSVADKPDLLQEIFGDIMQNKFQLNDTYFTLRPEGASNESTLYRFNLTYGVIVNIGDLLMPNYKTCRLNQTEGEVHAACQFDIKNGEVQYYGQMSYRQPVVQTFRLYALIKEFPFGDHMNPASLTMIVYFKNGTADIRQCLITNFMLTTVTIPPFWLFDYSDFKNNVTLAAAVWDEFQVYMFTHVRVIAMNAIKDTCIKQLKSKRIRTCT
ncbi:uncharacterized protein LOC142558058 isoform X2 [Dermacentor variabilis]|uniref:uncharacterized protein LOC142558058 isoform X2 n=1 Tax=Dermacentor variabilis TaxID=34621 RepID=UPI003F5B7BC2